jgi:hypothetical protein
MTLISKLNLFLFLLILTGCEISYKKLSVREGGATTSGPSAGIFLNARVCLEGAFDPLNPFFMNNELDNLGYLPLTSPYTNLAPWFHQSFLDQTLDPSQLGQGQWVDWVLVQLYQEVNGVMIFQDAQSAMVHNDGTLYEPTFAMLQGLHFPNLPEGNYYINVIHRNHLAMATAQAISISADYDELVYNVDFTQVSVPLLGGFVLKDDGNSGSIRCMAAGDVDGNGEINSDDLATIDETMSAVVQPPNAVTLFGYWAPDVNFDGRLNFNSSDDHNLIFANDGIATPIHGQP